MNVVVSLDVEPWEVLECLPCARLPGCQVCSGVALYSVTAQIHNSTYIHTHTGCVTCVLQSLEDVGLLVVINRDIKLNMSCMKVESSLMKSDTMWSCALYDIDYNRFNQHCSIYYKKQQCINSKKKIKCMILLNRIHCAQLGQRDDLSAFTS